MTAAPYPRLQFSVFFFFTQVIPDSHATQGPAGPVLAIPGQAFFLICFLTAVGDLLTVTAAEQEALVRQFSSKAVAWKEISCRRREGDVSKGQ